jgi:hypothetical protein
MALVVPSTLGSTPVVGEQLFLQNILGVNAAPATILYVHLYSASSQPPNPVPNPAQFSSQSAGGMSTFEQLVSTAISDYAPQPVYGTPTSTQVGWQFTAGTGTITATTTAPVTFTLGTSTSGATINGYFVTNSHDIASSGASLYWVEQFTNATGTAISFPVSASGGTIQITLQLSLVNN